MKIVRLGAHEGERLRAVRLAALGDAPDAFGGTLAEAAVRPADDWRRQLVELATFVAVVEGGDAGMVRAARHEVEPDTGELLSMWVAPAARGRGVGDALVDAVVAWARAEGLRRLVLDVGDANAAAIALYARNGFVPTGVTGSLPPPRTHVREHQRARPI
ncbi:GNAT family N-acetyltransferase [Nannocystis sp. ILAH1]|uniref:GNAT family N-acetyltransferase n=1 Tax=unclassified Nannocystis TaxID=2627009 RepID=UPI00226E72A5|nr:MULTISPECIES: GNAT family N-acetyltransferase [unclassified Nannocystis]MCY0989278.1 GNAT family N-acetyltransferase [Nannocystis sp. ILAH1]MCY1065027.1 GNAT family N-acetyltransferase [Nannocystis sp. RBIL2]